MSSQTIYPPGLNLPAKYPFWSAIMLLNSGSISVPANAVTYVDIQPAPNETWFAFIQAFLGNLPTNVTNQPVYIYINKYDGTTLSQIGGDYGQMSPSYGFYRLPSININAIVSNSLWIRLSFYQTAAGISGTGYYGYSGFKLSKPLWKTTPAVDPKPFKQKASQLPDVLTPLSDLAVDIYDPSINDYKTSIILEENTPIALDPNTQFPVERLSVYVSVNDLVDIINGIKKRTFDPVKSGWKKYLDKWDSLGIKVV